MRYIKLLLLFSSLNLGVVQMIPRSPSSSRSISGEHQTIDLTGFRALPRSPSSTSERREINNVTSSASSESSESSTSSRSISNKSNPKLFKQESMIDLWPQDTINIKHCEDTLPREEDLYPENLPVSQDQRLIFGPPENLDRSENKCSRILQSRSCSRRKKAERELRAEASRVEEIEQVYKTAKKAYKAEKKAWEAAEKAWEAAEKAEEAVTKEYNTAREEYKTADKVAKEAKETWEAEEKAWEVEDKAWEAAADKASKAEREAWKALQEKTCMALAKAQEEAAADKAYQAAIEAWKVAAKARAEALPSKNNITDYLESLDLSETMAFICKILEERKGSHPDFATDGKILQMHKLINHINADKNNIYRLKKIFESYKEIYENDDVKLKVQDNIYDILNYVITKDFPLNLKQKFKEKKDEDDEIFYQPFAFFENGKFRNKELPVELSVFHLVACATVGEFIKEYSISLR